MRYVNLSLFFALSATAALAQGPLYDKVVVNLPYQVTVNDRVLEPGEYTIRQLPSAAKSPVLLIYSDKGMKFRTSAMTIPTLDNRTPEDTKVMLHHLGGDYYFDKIWIQGKNYGYEFVLPDKVKSRERERAEPVTFAARYESTPVTTEERTQQTTSEATAQTQTERRETTEVAQAAPPAQPAPIATQPAPEPSPSPSVVGQGSANRDMPQDASATRMPATSAGWLTMLLGGGTLTGFGVALRRAARR